MNDALQIASNFVGLSSGEEDRLFVTPGEVTENRQEPNRSS